MPQPAEPLLSIAPYCTIQFCRSILSDHLEFIEENPLARVPISSPLPASYNWPVKTAINRILAI